MTSYQLRNLLSALDELNGEEIFLKRVGCICVDDSFYGTVKKKLAQHYKNLYSNKS